MTTEIQPRCAVRYKMADYPEDKGFAYFNSEDDATLFRDVINAVENADLTGIHYEAIRLSDMTILEEKEEK